MLPNLMSIQDLKELLKSKGLPEHLYAQLTNKEDLIRLYSAFVQPLPQRQHRKTTTDRVLVNSQSILTSLTLKDARSPVKRKTSETGDVVVECKKRVRSNSKEQQSMDQDD